MKTQLRPAWIDDGTPIADPRGRGQQAVDFLRALKHPKSDDGAFELAPFWERIVRRIYGPVGDDSLRQVKTAFILLPRGARKTTIGAGLSLLHACGGERRAGGLCIAAAAAEDQAAIAFDEATAIVKATPWLDKRMKLNQSTLEMSRPDVGTTFRAIASKGSVQLGRTPAFVLADELIAWEGRSLWKALRTGLSKTSETLLIIITQAGRGQTGLAWEVFEYARKVRDGTVIDPAFLPVIFETPHDVDWRDEDLWRLVNPGLDLGFPDLAGLRQLAREAAERPADRDDFRQFHLNTWLDHSLSPFVDMPVYDDGAEMIDEAELEGEPCWIAVDMGLTTDLTAVVAAFRDIEDGYTVLAWLFCPEENLEGRADRDGVPYPRWAKEGRIIPTPGNVTDHRAVEAHIRGLCERFVVREIAFDPAYAQAVAGPLTEDGYPTASMRQGWVTMAPAIKELERAIIGRRFRHGGHPVLRWNFENISVHADSAGNRTFHKGKSKERIDGAVAAAMAVGRAALGDLGGFVYADADARPEGIEFW